MKNLLKILVLSVFFIFVTGCASTEEKLSTEKRNSFQSVAIISADKIPDEVFYTGPEHAFGATLGGVVGALVAQGASTTGEKIETHIKNNKIDIQGIFHKEFTTIFRGSDNLADKIITTPGEADATIRLVIGRYGFGQPHGFSSQRKPLIIGGIEILDKQGNRIYAGSASVTPLNSELYGTDLDNYFSNPSNFEKAF